MPDLYPGPGHGEPTLTEALLARGYTHKRADRRGVAHGAHDVIDGQGVVVATMKAHETWEWLRTAEEK